MRLYMNLFLIFVAHIMHLVQATVLLSDWFDTGLQLLECLVFALNNVY